jgi:hypothetical protein
MKLTFVFPVDCEVIQTGNTVIVVSRKNEINAPVVVSGVKEETNRYLQAKDDKEKLKMHVV